MLLDLKSLFSGESDRLPFSCEINLSETEYNGMFPFVSPVAVEGVATASYGSVQLEAEVSFDYEAPCDRCTASVKRRYHYRFSHLLSDSQEEKDDDSIHVDEEHTLDLDELLRSDILLELPYKFLCREECKGLCPSCGKNLNEGPCGCNLHQIDPRLEVLRKLID